MTPSSLHLRIQVEHLPETTIVLDNVSPDSTVAQVIQEILRRTRLDPSAGWRLCCLGLPLPADGRIGALLPLTTEPIALVLQMPVPEEDGDIFETDFDVPSLDEEAASEVIALDEAGTGPATGEFELSLEEESGIQVVAIEEEDEVGFDELDQDLDEEPAAEKEVEEEEAASPRRRSSSPGSTKPAAQTRRATVRYYSRMNPERVYPLLVVISKAMIERVQKKDTAQRSSGPFKVDVESPVEIEPLVPGCQCYPPRITARLGKGDLTATFRVVPHMLGKVDGASVTIRQNHVSLAEIPLDMKVVQRGLVLLSGGLTFLLPALSSFLQHFGMDLSPNSEAGFNLYLSAGRLLFESISPLTLTAVLGLVTGVLWWLTRPRTRDVFWDIEKVGPGEKLRRIAAALEANPEQTSRDLMDLLKAFPDHQPAWLFYAEWQFNTENFAAALKGYERALKLGAIKARDYHRASLSASRLGQNERALRLLQEAERRLPPEQMDGILFFNMGCYHVRLGRLDEAMTCLQRAVKAGYRKRESYTKDRDLNPLRGRADFKQLLFALQHG